MRSSGYKIFILVVGAFNRTYTSNVDILKCSLEYSYISTNQIKTELQIDKFYRYKNLYYEFGFLAHEQQAYMFKKI